MPVGASSGGAPRPSRRGWATRGPPLPGRGPGGRPSGGGPGGAWRPPGAPPPPGPGGGRA
ncbi:hypothetical protein CSW37_09575 [Thermus scotoductus]|uniref:Uncharacterized protein n=1 Tax=Thermus scotoductus TaxID=37636 RepID=A0A430SC68_THESC|nr:hypothetical protein CSW37_09575 [Thermus scotoductus]